MSIRSISSEVERSRDAVSRFLKRPALGNQKKWKARNRKMTAGDKRLLIREACKGKRSAAQLKCDLQLPVNVRQIQKILQSCMYLRYDKMQRAPYMNDRHRLERVKWVKAVSEWGAVNWKKVIFSDEKKFNLDGPDGLACYWHDIRREKKFFEKRQQGGESVMVWGAISYYGVGELAILDGKQDSAGYSKTLRDNLLPFAAETLGETWTFQQDNASIHRSKVTKKWFKDNNIEVMPWPAKSPDLNIIENVWGHLVRAVYPNGKQYSSREELLIAIGTAWWDLSECYLQKLYKSIPRRLYKVIEQNGRTIDY